jgi:glutaconate CoA-transferase, subunit B
MTAGRWDPDPIESLVIAMADQIRPGETWGVGMSTHLPLVALSLGRAIRGFDFKIYLPDEGVYLVRRGGGGTSPEGLLDGVRPYPVPVTEVFNEDLGPRYGEFFRPAQLDADGRLNIARVRGRLVVGYAGIAEAMARYDRVFAYTARHDRRFFVGAVDVITADMMARADGTRRRSATVLTNLGVFDLEPEHQHLRVRYLYPSASLAQVRDATGIEVACDGAAPRQDPRPDRLRLLREHVDPGRARDREAARGAARGIR